MTLPDRQPNRYCLTDFVTALHYAATLDEAFAAYDRCAQLLGFEGVLYAYVPRLHLEARLAVAPVFQVSASRNPVFMEHYRQEGLERHDFTLNGILQGRKDPIDWWGEERKGILTPDEHKLIVLAKEDYGIRNGLTIPLLNGAQGVAGASIASSEPDRLYARLKQENFAAFLSCTRIFHAHVMDSVELRQFFLAPMLGLLTDKEKRLLEFVVKGKPMKQVSDYLPDVSPKYAERLLETIRAKFGGINKNRLIYYAGLLQLLDHL